MPSGPYVPRRAGLSRNVRVQPLLSMVGPKQTDTGRQRKITEPDDPAAPPLSDSSSASDDDEPASRRGDIKRTTFQTKADTSSGRKVTPTKGSRKSARTASRPGKPQSPKRPRDSEDEIDQPVKRAKSDGLGSHFRADAVVRSKAAGPKKAYGKAARASFKPVPTPEPLSSPQKTRPEYKPVDSLDDLSSPEKPKRRFVAPNARELTATPSPKKTYKAPSEPDDDLDTPSPAKRFQPPTATDPDLQDSSPEKAATTMTANSKKTADELMRQAFLLRQKKKAEKEAKLRRELEMEEERSPEVVFKLPGGMDTQDDLAYDSDLDDVGNESQLEVCKPVHDMFDDREEGPVCPMCREPVDQELLDKFGRKSMVTLAQQRRFCNYHTTSTARQTWIDQGYPDIDWSALDERIAKHHRFLEDILNGGSSHYGALLAKNVRSGKNRTLLKADQNVTPGYYGSRGARVMNENIIHSFSDLLRKVAVRDRLVSARGHMAFVQFVLVPELAVRLIMEDMDVPAEKARTIMDESQRVGNLLNEEEDDVIVEDKEDQSDGDQSDER